MLRTVSPSIMVIGCVIAALFLAADARSGAWPRAENEAYLKWSLSRFHSDEIYAPKNNKKIPGPDYTDITSAFYGEYGFSPTVTGICSLTMKSLSSEFAGVERTETGLSDIWLYVKKGWTTRPAVFATQFGVKIPGGYDKNRVPPLGEGQVDMEARALVGRSFRWIRGYGGAELAYRKRNGDFSDEIPYRLEAGVFAGPRWLVKFVLDGVDNTTNDEAGEFDPTRAANVYDKQYRKIAPSLIYFFGRGFAAELYYETHIAGANESAGDTVGLAVSWQGTLRDKRGL